MPFEYLHLYNQRKMLYNKDRIELRIRSLLMKYAVIDIGSNTVRLAVYTTDGKTFHPLFSQKYTASLAGYVQNDILTQEGIQKACSVLLGCRTLLEQFQLEQTFVFATASLRNIQNTREAVDQIFLMTGYSVDVLSGQAEAYLDYYGVHYEAPMEKGLLFDIGGGSTEIVTVAHDGPGIIESLPIGSLTLSKAYVEKVFPRQKEREVIQERIRKELKKRKLNHLPVFPNLCGVGGTARTVLKLAQAQQELPETQRILTTSQFRTLEKALWKKDAAARELLLQNCPDRLHTIYTGMLILDALVQLTKCESIYISKYGIREGYLRRELSKKKNEQPRADKA